MADSKPLVVLLCLTDYALFKDRSAHLLKTLGERSQLHVAKTRSEALRFLTSTVRPRAVIACDEAVAFPEYHDVLLPLTQYAQAGGTVVYAGIFAMFIRFTDMNAMFKVGWGLPWEMRWGGNDHKVYAINFAAKGLDLKSLPKKYGIRAVQLTHVYPDAAVYLGQNQLKKLAKDKSLMSVPLDAPVVFSKTGLGYVGYIGDMSASEETTTAVVLAMCFHPASKALVAPGTVSSISAVNSDAPPRRTILVISLEPGWMGALYEPLYRALRKNAWVTEGEDAETALQLLSARPPPSAVLFSDGAITRPEHAQILSRLIEYVRAGGTAVFGAQFSNTISFLDLDPFFAKWGLAWPGGDYTRTTFTLNPAGVPAPLEASALVPEVCMKAVHVKAPRECAVYLPAPDAYTQSPVFAPTRIAGARAEQSPAAFGRVGNGYVGYVGDVNGEQASLRLIVEMLGVKIKPGDLGSRMTTTSVSSHPVHGISAKYAEEAEIPLPAPAAQRRPREAEVTARKKRRAETRKEKISRADALKGEGNTFFAREMWVEAADKYLAAAMVAGPQPVYMSNLAASLLKLSLWELAESAACRALLHDPDNVKALYRRALARKGLERFAAAEADLKRVLELDRNNELALQQLESVEGGGSSRDDWPGDDQIGREGGPEQDEPLELEDESDSEDFSHTGNGKPCKPYNHAGCAQGRQCRASHAPDARSVRDELGRNVCVYWLLGECRFGDVRCFYAHDKTYLPPPGWWTNKKRLSRMCKAFDNAVAASPLPGVESEGILAEALKPFSWRKDAWTVGNYAELAKFRAERMRADAGEDEEPEPWEREMEERAMYGGHTVADFHEMLMYGIKPFDFDAMEELAAVRRALDRDSD